MIRECAEHGKRHLYRRALRCRVFIVLRLQCLRTARELLTRSLNGGMAPMCHLDNLADPIGRSIAEYRRFLRVQALS